MLLLVFKNQFHFSREISAKATEILKSSFECYVYHLSLLLLLGKMLLWSSVRIPAGFGEVMVPSQRCQCAVNNSVGSHPPSPGEKS